MLSGIIILWNCILIVIWGYLAFINEAHSYSPAKTGLEASATYAVNVSGNWRIFFKFIDGNAYIVNYDDYH